MQSVVFPDATAVLVSFLRTELAARSDSATVGSRVPNPRPDRFVLVRRVGGPALNRVADNATVTIECWDLAAEDAHDLAQLCRALVHSLPGSERSGTPIYRVTELAGPGELPDPLSDHPRYTVTMQVAMRGTSLEAS